MRREFSLENSKVKSLVDYRLKVISQSGQAVVESSSSLASDSHVAASTQNQALNALLFLYHQVLERKIGLIQGVVRAKRPRRLPVVLTKEEVRRVLSGITGTPWVMAMLLYGAGLRVWSVAG